MVQVRKAVFGEGERGCGTLDLAAVLSLRCLGNSFVSEMGVGLCKRDTNRE